jgi:hypothetical protein
VYFLILWEVLQRHGSIIQDDRKPLEGSVNDASVITSLLHRSEERLQTSTERCAKRKV